jgi:hypothetical protein
MRTVAENLWRCSSKLGATSSGAPKQWPELGFWGSHWRARPLSPVPLPPSGVEAERPPDLRCGGEPAQSSAASLSFISVVLMDGRRRREDGWRRRTYRWGPPASEPEK